MYKMRCPLSELRIGPLVVAFADDCNELMLIKAQMIVNREIQYPELLEIYFQGREPWIFDCKLTPFEASKIVSEFLLTRFHP